MINTQQNIFAEATQDTRGIEDIAETLETGRQLFDESGEVYQDKKPENEKVE